MERLWRRYCVKLYLFVVYVFYLYSARVLRQQNSKSFNCAGRNPLNYFGQKNAIYIGKIVRVPALAVSTSSSVFTRHSKTMEFTEYPCTSSTDSLPSLSPNL